MSRRQIIKANEVLCRRASNWARHYQARQWVTASGLDTARILRMIETYASPCTLDNDASTLAPRDGSQRNCFERLTLPYLLPISNCGYDMMNVWYWGVGGWMEFVRLFNALPDVLEDHYLWYNSKTDTIHTMPMSFVPSRYVDNPVDNPVDNSGESLGKLCQFPRRAHRKRVQVEL